jgi:hypothetical protein
VDVRVERVAVDLGRQVKDEEGRQEHVERELVALRSET